MNTYFFTAFFAAILCIIVLWVLTPLSSNVGLLDEPDSRKRHWEATPMVGGIAIFLSLLISAFLVAESTLSWSLMLWFGLVVAIGVLDDIFDVSYRIRLGTHAAVVVGIWLTDGLLVNNIGGIFGSTDVDFYGPLALIFTAIGVIGAVNSTNMMDGVDGLLGSLVLISLAVVFVLATVSTTAAFHLVTPHAVAAVIGALLSFLWFNSRIARRSATVFLGDAGSTFLGFFLVYLLIDYSQGSNSVFSPVLAGWLVGLPLLDASAVIVNRTFAGRSPVKPDRQHLHHRLIDSGMTVNQTVSTMVIMHVALILVGIAVSYVFSVWGDTILFWSFVFLVVLHANTSTTFDFVKSLKHYKRHGGRAV